MGYALVNTVNAVFAWSVIALAVIGYFVTLARKGERWSLWFVLAAAWTFVAIPNTMLAAGFPMRRSELTVLWLCSYVLVMASLVLIFLKIVEMKRRASARR